MGKKIIMSLVFVFVIAIVIVIVALIWHKSKTGNALNDNLNTKEDVSNPKRTIKINIIIGDYEFLATLENNESSKELIKLFPMKVNMEDHLSNEKYCNLFSPLPTNNYNPSEIKTGDLMLFGSDTLVLFYKNFNTSYSYTKLGKIDNPTNLELALSDDKVTVTFEIIE